MSKATVCSNCGGSDIDTDQARGNAVCVSCGAVIEDNFIVSEVGFAENTLGGTSVIGQFVSSEGDKSHTLGNNFRHGYGKESRTVTLQQGKRHIQNLGGQLKLNQHRNDMAYNFFKMAVQKKLTRGRKTMHIVAACLYLVCRLESTPHMLLDLSDLLQVNVYVLGKTYLKLCQELHINVPAIDPCLFIQRFAHKLEFDERTDVVCETALRLVSRMKRDWMHTGRRPSGLCGAALLVAARMHNFSRTQKDVIKVVKVCDATLRKRLSEFEETPSGKLTIDEFHKIDLEEEQDPPSFTRGRRTAKLAQLEELSKKQVRELEGEIATIQNEIESALHKKVPDAAAAALGSVPEEDDSNAGGAEPSKENIELLKRLEGDSVKTLIENKVNSHKQSQGVDETGENADLASKSSVNADTGGGGDGREGEEKGGGDGEGVGEKGGEDGASGAGGGGGGDATSTEKTLPSGDVIDTLLGSAVWSDEDKGLGPSPLSLGFESIIKEAAIPEEKSPDSDDGELDLTGIDEKEMELFILSEKEVMIKTTLWMKENGEYMKLMEEKELRLRKERELLGLKPDQPKKKRKNNKKPPIQANTAGEAIEKLLVEKKISSKINYDVLRDLTQPSPSHKPSQPSQLAETSPSVNLSTPFRAGGVSQGAQLTRAGSLGGVKRLRQGITPTRPTVREGPAQKTAKLEPKEEKNPNPFTMPQPKAPDDIVVESGPVQYDAEDGPHHEDEGEDEYYDEEDDHLQSAAQLMGHRGDDDYQDNYEMDDLE
eukprot:XP_794011.3 PREDICTED: transcription factor IIIB 90 kDa subunit [Strongylocentrotus purpuratus]